MTRALPRTNFNSSRLLRFLAERAVEDVAESTQAFAERLGEWLDFSDAITLSTLLGTRVATPSAGQSVAQPAASSLAAQSGEDEFVSAFARIQTTLLNSITKRCSSVLGEVRIEWCATPDAKPTAASRRLAVVAAYAPYRRLHAALQREMEAGLRPLRAAVRDALLKASPALAQLATLDAVMERMLGERERSLLSTVPLLLEQRFGALLKAHQSAGDEAGPALGTSPGGWLAGFGKEFEAALRAELDLRLQPIIGLMEAFSNEARKDQ